MAPSSQDPSERLGTRHELAKTTTSPQLGNVGTNLCVKLQFASRNAKARMKSYNALGVRGSEPVYANLKLREWGLSVIEQ